MNHVLSNNILLQLEGFVAQNLGLSFPKDIWASLERNIISAAKEFGFDDTERFVKHIISTPLTRENSEILASYLTINETYFWRESESFEALEKKIFPELIKKRKREEKRIRIWSAGCSTGEEPYSIAIALRRLIPDIDQWNITILASDINPKILQKAIIGEYGQWSFRSAPQWLKEKYFIPKEKGKFEIIPEIKSMVTFEYLNLAEDIFPSSLNNTNAMDIIFCRNVLMYFTQNRATQTLRGLYNSLIQGGYLVVSASELSLQNYAEFATVNFPGVVFYRKISKKIEHQQQQELTVIGEEYKPIIFELPLKHFEIEEKTKPQISEIENENLHKTEIPINVDSLYEEALSLYSQGSYTDVISKLQKNNLAVDEQILLIRAYANQGKLGDALKSCEKAIAKNKVDPRLHYLYATILQENSQLNEAIAALKRAIFLDSDFVLSYFSLGNIYRQQGNMRNTKKCYENVLSIINKRSHDDILLEFEGLNIGRLKEIINASLQVSI
ncbi:MAG: hypothetical protein A2041_14210 [Bacteroidetes bacterium GWA2_31_9b]|nr:MAG: hypothetical protein A2041_14210 [Bacteroidetes bacterium GWA2_31_9b]